MSLSPIYLMGSLAYWLISVIYVVWIQTYCYIICYKCLQDYDVLFYSKGVFPWTEFLDFSLVLCIHIFLIHYLCFFFFLGGGEIWHTPKASRSVMHLNCSCTLIGNLWIMAILTLLVGLLWLKPEVPCWTEVISMGLIFLCCNF